jgi:hypothetical protein
VTAIDCVVAPFDQSQLAAAPAVSVTLPPAQNVVGPFAVTTGAAGVVTVTLMAFETAETQPFASVAVAV